MKLLLKKSKKHNLVVKKCKNVALEWSSADTPNVGHVTGRRTLQDLNSHQPQTGTVLKSLILEVIVNTTVNRNWRFLLYEYRPVANYDSAKTSFGNTIATSRRAFSATVAARLRRREASPFAPHGCILQKLPDNREKIQRTVAIGTPHSILFCHDSVSNCAAFHWPVL